MEDRELLQWEYDTKGYAILKQAIPQLLCKEILEKIQDFEHCIGTLSDKQRNSHVFIHELTDVQRDGIDATVCKDMLYIIGDICEYFPEITQILAHPSVAHITNILLGTDNPIYHFSNITIKSACCTQTGTPKRATACMTIQRWQLCSRSCCSGRWNSP